MKKTLMSLFVVTMWSLNLHCQSTSSTTTQTDHTSETTTTITHADGSQRTLRTNCAFGDNGGSCQTHEVHTIDPITCMMDKACHAQAKFCKHQHVQVVEKGSMSVTFTEACQAAWDAEQARHLSEASCSGAVINGVCHPRMPVSQ